MAVERKFIAEAIKKVKIDRYIHKELSRVGCGNIDVKRTPLGTRIMISAIKPGLVIGRKGKNIQTLTDTLRDDFKIDNPQIEVQDVEVPEYNPDLMVKQLASTLERGTHFRRAAYSLLKQIMDAGALGAQIEISGKISGARARQEKFKEGYIKHCGETASLYVKEATTQANLKPGVIGIKIKIVPPTEEGFFKELQLKEKIEKPSGVEKAEPETKKEETKKEEEKFTKETEKKPKTKKQSKKAKKTETKKECKK